MLEVKNLHKEYKTKKGVVTKALNDVSLTFPEKGMVFILGKSGSGKSTLLNVCGGLDRYDSGEIIIKGRSSKDFSAQDFDSYRNTYVGFVFQEYNILDGFSVEENIALALELQNKKRDKATIDKILQDVDMAEFASRRPNTLSGGQKQRVAIARALVKEPEIIMADEPTGALDSKTGKQVFETLKKLSRDKLVLVVSHDREFAEQYGDRIIELKDGQVLSDMTREEVDPEARNVSFYGTDTICVRSGADVTDDDLNSIKKFLTKNGGTAVITTSREQINHVKENVPELDIGEFKDIGKQPESKEYPAQKLIRSRFPLRHAVRMGAGSLKTKPVRLVFTLLLSVVAFILFGLASTVMFFDKQSVTEETLMSSDFPYITFQKEYYYTQQYYENDELVSEWESTQKTNFDNSEYDKFVEKYPGSIAAVEASFSFENVGLGNFAEQFYSRSVDGLIIANDSLQMLAGRMPQAKGETAISDYIFDSLKLSATSFKYTQQAGEELADTKIKVSDYNSVIYSERNPVTLRVGNGTELKITGVFKGDNVPSAYTALKQAADENKAYSEGEIRWQWQEARSGGMYAFIAVTEDFIEEYRNSGSSQSDIQYFEYSQSSYEILGESGVESIDSDQRVAKYDPDGNKPVRRIYDAQGNAVNGKLAANTVGVYVGEYANIFAYKYRKYAEDPSHFENDPDVLEQVEARRQDLISRGYDQDSIDEEIAEYKLQLCRDKGYDISNKINEMKDLLRDDETGNPSKDKIPQYVAALDALKTEAAARGVVLDGKFIIKSQADNVEREVSLAGFYLTESFDSWESGIYPSDDLYEYLFIGNSYYDVIVTKYKIDSNAYISSIFVPYGDAKTSALTHELVELSDKRAEDDSVVMITNNIVRQLEMVSSMMKDLGTVFLWLGVALAAFSFLLMFNFISASISAKKKEIGILRAIGARSLDVFKIFMSESLIIALICIAVAIGGTFALCMVINDILIEGTMIAVTIFVFGWMSVLCIVGIALVTALISTLIPVIIYSRKPPIASIRAL